MFKELGHPDKNLTDMHIKLIQDGAAVEPELMCFDSFIFYFCAILLSINSAYTYSLFQLHRY